MARAKLLNAYSKIFNWCFMGSNYINEWEGMTRINWNEWIERKDLTKGSSLRSKVVVTAGSNALGECTVLMTRYQRT